MKGFSVHTLWLEVLFWNITPGMLKIQWMLLVWCQYDCQQVISLSILAENCARLMEKNRWTSWAVWERCAAAVSVLIEAKRKKADAGYTVCSGHNVSFFPWISYKDLSFFVHSGGCCGKEQHEHYCLIWPRLAFVLEMSQKKIQHTQNTSKKICRKHSSQLNNLIVSVTCDMTKAN